MRYSLANCDCVNVAPRRDRDAGDYSPLHGDLAGLGGLVLRQRQPQHAVLVLRLDLSASTSAGSVTARTNLPNGRS